MDITLLHIHSSLINCFNKVIFLHFYNELKFHILSRDQKVLGLSPGIKIPISSKSGHGTFVLSTIDIIIVKSTAILSPTPANIYYHKLTLIKCSTKAELFSYNDYQCMSTNNSHRRNINAWHHKKKNNPRWIFINTNFMLTNLIYTWISTAWITVKLNQQ